MINKKIKLLQFKFAVLKLKRNHWKLVKHNLKTLIFCQYWITKIGIPISKTEKEAVQSLLSLYDETVKDINKNADAVRPYINEV